MMDDKDKCRNPQKQNVFYLITRENVTKSMMKVHHLIILYIYIYIYIYIFFHY